MTALRFRITDVLFVTAAIALGCGVAQLPKMSWLDGAFVTMSVLIATITARECVTLYKNGKSQPGLSNDQRRQLSFLVRGRLAVVLLLLTANAVDLMANLDVLELLEGDFNFAPAPGLRARSALIDLALLICIISPTLTRSVVRRSLWRSAVNQLTFVAAGAFAVLVLTQETFVHFLVYLAVRSDEQSQFRQPAQALASESHFANLLIFQELVVIVLVAAVQFAAVHWQARRLRNALLLVVAAGVCALSWSAMRTIAVELRDISPATQEGIIVGPIHRWVSTAALVVLACIAWTYVVIRRSRLYESAASIPVASAWQARAMAPALVLALYTLNGAFVVYYLIDNPQFGASTWDGPFAALGTTEHYFSLAVWIAAIAQLYRAWRQRKTPPAVGLHGLSRGQFVTLTIFNFALAAVGGFIAAWLSFALWLTPWYRWFG